ncbi:LPP20 family lipoprotein [Marinospirillum minutulum]|uniref:LPP20 family lipoprotein n=1 Tax=Marinospirillum minutulum TaxID=64974 RepID=UPI00041727D1|nr:LPP20 family lipoprotein [Marinospirillum minutulum]
MKKNIFSLSALAFTFAVMAGCGDKQVAQQPTEPVKPTFVEHCEYKPGIQAPEWYCSPNIEGGLAAVGEAKPNVARDNNMQRTMAMANARDALARQTQVKVQNLLTNWSRATGAGENQTYEANFENVSRQVSQQTLEGSRQLKRWLTPDGTLVLLVGVSDSASVKEGLKTSLKNEEALWQQFQSKQALEELDKQMDAEFK